ncbi:hypothetical protein BGZ76_004369, partial [Entomortierella beljakovae]
MDSDVDSYWTCNGIQVDGDLMACRDRIVENNGGLAELYEKPTVNFTFRVEAEYQTGGLQGQVEDETWDAICETVKDPVFPLSNEAIAEVVTQYKTRGSESNLLIPDYAVTTHVRNQQISVVLLGSKIAKNAGNQLWDDLTKLGMEMKTAFDSI